VSGSGLARPGHTVSYCSLENALLSRPRKHPDEEDDERQADQQCRCQRPSRRRPVRRAEPPGQVAVRGDRGKDGDSKQPPSSIDRLDCEIIRFGHPDLRGEFEKVSACRDDDQGGQCQGQEFQDHAALLSARIQLPCQCSARTRVPGEFRRTSW
jgi:hypothetical protein